MKMKIIKKSLPDKKSFYAVLYLIFQKLIEDFKFLIKMRKWIMVIW